MKELAQGWVDRKAARGNENCMEAKAASCALNS